MKIAIVGAGASGMMISAILAEKNISDLEVFLFDKNPVIGKKVAITGGGRCNLTNSLKDKKLFLSKYIRGKDFVSELFSQFSPKKTFSWFESHGLKLKVEDNFRVFPNSQKGDDVIEFFLNLIKSNKNIKLRLQEKVEKLEKNGEKFILKTDKQDFEFDKIVITTGGSAYAQTGSSGDGYSLASSLGHKITKLAPSLSSFEIKESFFSEISGLAFSNSGIVFDNKKINGALIFTHFGISGPVIFELSAHLAYSSLPYKIGFIPDISRTYEFYDGEIQKFIKENPTKQLKSILSEFLPKRFVEILTNYNLDLTKIGANLSKEERKYICHLLTSKLEINLISRKAGDEFVTAGGVDLSEINYQTSESKLVSGLYFAGEVLDVDAVTGGFNLQYCWSNGAVVAENIIK